MKALFVGNTSWSMWNFRSDVMSYFKDRGWDITVVAPPDDSSSKLVNMGFKYVPLANLDRKGLNPIKDIKLFFEFFRIFKKEQPDLIFHYTIKPNIWGSLAAATLRLTFLSSAKTVSMVSGLGYVFIRKTWLTSVVAILYKIAFIFARKVIFLNKEDMDDFFRFRILNPQQDKAILMNGEGVDTNYFRPNDPISLPNKPTLLFVGRLLVDKGVREFVEAARMVKEKYPNSQFQILGGIDPGNPADINQEELDSWLNEGVVSYLGTTDDVRPYFQKATAIVLPSYLEGLSRVLMEALAIGKPIIASNVRGCKELVEPGKNGYLVEPSNSQSLAQAFIKLLSLDRTSLLDLSKNSRKKSEIYSLNKAISFYQGLVSAMTGQSYDQQICVEP